MKHLIVGFLGMMLAASASAQTFTDHLEKNEPGKGKVVIHQDGTLERLVNGAPKASAKGTAGPAAQHKDTATQHKEVTHTDSDTNTIMGDQNTPKVYRSKISVMGYRIQVYAGGNSRTAREQAMKKGNLVKRYFPELPVYTHFYSPRWTCRVGDFKTYAEASHALSQLKAAGTFGEAVIVKCKIQIAY